MIILIIQLIALNAGVNISRRSASKLDNRSEAREVTLPERWRSYGCSRICLKIRTERLSHISPARFSCMKRSDRRTADCSQFTKIKIAMSHKDCSYTLAPNTFMPGRRFPKSLPTRLPVSLPIAATAAKSRKPDNIEAGNMNQTLESALGST